jgi:hypothetical protein
MADVTESWEIGPHHVRGSRIAAGAGAVAAAGAIVVPLVGYGWHASAGLLCVAASCAFLSYDLAKQGRWWRDLAREDRRAERLERMRAYSPSREMWREFDDARAWWDSSEVQF